MFFCHLFGQVVLGYFPSEMGLKLQKAVRPCLKASTEITK